MKRPRKDAGLSLPNFSVNTQILQGGKTWGSEFVQTAMHRVVKQVNADKRIIFISTDSNFYYLYTAEDKFCICVNPNFSADCIKKQIPACIWFMFFCQPENFFRWKIGRKGDLIIVCERSYVS